MVTRRADDDRTPAVSTGALSGRSLEGLQNIFLSPPKFVVGTTASEAAYRLMVGTKGGLSAFWEEAIRSFDGDLEALVKIWAQRGDKVDYRDGVLIQDPNAEIWVRLYGNGALYREDHKVGSEAYIAFITARW